MKRKKVKNRLGIKYRSLLCHWHLSNSIACNYLQFTPQSATDIRHLIYRPTHKLRSTFG